MFLNDIKIMHRMIKKTVQLIYWKKKLRPISQMKKKTVYPSIEKVVANRVQSTHRKLKCCVLIKFKFFEMFDFQKYA